MNLGRGFQWLMISNAGLTLAASILLTVSPDTIPSTVGFPTVRDAHPMGYMLAAAELGLALLFYFGRKMEEPRALRLIIATAVTFHVASALGESYSLVQNQAGNAVWANITLRVVLGGLLLYYGIAKLPIRSAAVDPNPGPA